MLNSMIRHAPADGNSDPGPAAIVICPECGSPQRIVRWILDNHQITDPVTGETADCVASGWGLAIGRLILPESDYDLTIKVN